MRTNFHLQSLGIKKLLVLTRTCYIGGIKDYFFGDANEEINSTSFKHY